MMKLMTAETVFHAIKQGESSSRRISASAKTPGARWRPSGLDDVCGHSQQDLRGRSPARAIIHSGNDACIALAEGIAARAHLR